MHDRRIESRGKTAVAVLAELLKDKDYHVRLAAARTLRLKWLIGPNAKAIIPALTESLKDENGRVRLAAAEALVAIDSKVDVAIRSILELLTHKEGYYRNAAAASLSDMASGVHDGMMHLESSPFRERSPALADLVSEVVPALMKLLKDSNGRVRWAAAEALQNIGAEAKAAVVPLTESLKDSNGNVREAAARG